MPGPQNARHWTDRHRQTGLWPRAAGANRYGAVNRGSEHGDGSKRHTHFTALLEMNQESSWRQRERRNKGTKPEDTEGGKMRTKRQSKRTKWWEISDFPGSSFFKATWAGVFGRVLSSAWVLLTGTHLQRLYLVQFMGDDTERKICSPSSGQTFPLVHQVQQHLLLELLVPYRHQAGEKTTSTPLYSTKIFICSL